jgi:hypothetical protein
LFNLAGNPLPHLPSWNLKNVPKSMKLKKEDIVTGVRGI